MARLFDDGASQYLETSNPVSNEPFTMACWFNSDDVTVNQVLMSVCTDGSGDDAWHLTMDGGVAGDPVSVQKRHLATGVVRTITGATVDTWHHACGVFAANDDIICYIDAGGKNSANIVQAVAGVDTLEISGRNGTGVLPVSGMVAEAAIWNVAFTDADVAMAAAGYAPPMIRPQNLVFYVPLVRDNDEDIVGGLSLTATNGPTIATHPPIIYPAPPIFYSMTAGAPPGNAMPMAMNHYRRLRT